MNFSLERSVVKIYKHGLTSLRTSIQCVTNFDREQAWRGQVIIGNLNLIVLQTNSYTKLQNMYSRMLQETQHVSSKRWGSILMLTEHRHETLCLATKKTRCTSEIPKMDLDPENDGFFFGISFSGWNHVKPLGWNGLVKRFSQLLQTGDPCPDHTSGYKTRHKLPFKLVSGEYNL